MKTREKEVYPLSLLLKQPVVWYIQKEKAGKAANSQEAKAKAFGCDKDHNQEKEKKRTGFWKCWQRKSGDCWQEAGCGERDSGETKVQGS